MPPRRTYLDWNATAPVRPEVATAMMAALGRCGNASSVHHNGRAARQAIEAARAAVAALCHVAAEEVTFTGGGSEANQLALRGFPGRRLVIAAIEHDSVRAAAPEAALIPAQADGTIDLAALEGELTRDPRPALVALMLANNETGAIQPVAAAAQLAHEKGALLHCDAIQAAGRLPLDREALGADCLSLSAHKIGGPQGVGALVAKASLPLAPLLVGGGQERGRRAGTENLPGIIGFGVAAGLAAAALADQPRIAALRDDAEQRLCDLAPSARVFAAAAPRLANTLCLSMPGVPAATQVMALDLAGVMVSAGAACSSGKLRPSHVLAAMGAPPDDADCAIRISFGWDSTAADVDHLIEAWGALYRRRQASAA